MNVPLAHLGDECPACQSGVRAHLLRQAQFKQSESFRAKRYAHLPTYLLLPRKGHKFSAFGLELAQPFLNTVFHTALKNLENK